MDPLLDAAKEYFVHLDESDNSACRLAGTSFVRTLRSGQGWDVAVREATKAVDTALKHDTLATLGGTDRPIYDSLILEISCPLQIFKCYGRKRPVRKVDGSPGIAFIVQNCIRGTDFTQNLDLKSP